MNSYKKPVGNGCYHKVLKNDSLDYAVQEAQAKFGAEAVHLMTIPTRTCHSFPSEDVKHKCS